MTRQTYSPMTERIKFYQRYNVLTIYCRNNSVSDEKFFFLKKSYVREFNRLSEAADMKIVKEGLYYILIPHGIISSNRNVSGAILYIYMKTN